MSSNTLNVIGRETINVTMFPSHLLAITIINRTKRSVTDQSEVPPLAAGLYPEHDACRRYIICILTGSSVRHKTGHQGPPSLVLRG